MEDLACDVYKRAAGRFNEDPTFTHFLHRLAEDEAQHSQLLASANDLFRSAGEFPEFAVILDTNTKDRLEKPVYDSLAMVVASDLTQPALLSNIVEAEFSEWNDIFLYVVTTCQKDFEDMAARRRNRSGTPNPDREVSRRAAGRPQADRGRATFS